MLALAADSGSSLPLWFHPLTRNFVDPPLFSIVTTSVDRPPSLGDVVMGMIAALISAWIELRRGIHFLLYLSDKYVFRISINDPVGKAG